MMQDPQAMQALSGLMGQFMNQPGGGGSGGGGAGSADGGRPGGALGDGPQG